MRLRVRVRVRMRARDRARMRVRDRVRVRVRDRGRVRVIVCCSARWSSVLGAQRTSVCGRMK